MYVNTLAGCWAAVLIICPVCIIEHGPNQSKRHLINCDFCVSHTTWHSSCLEYVRNVLERQHEYVLSHLVLIQLEPALAGADLADLGRQPDELSRGSHIQAGHIGVLHHA